MAEAPHILSPDPIPFQPTEDVITWLHGKSRAELRAIEVPSPDGGLPHTRFPDVLRYRNAKGEQCDLPILFSIPGEDELFEATEEAIRKAKPIPIPGLNDRANDAWEPLLAIADLVGEHWPKTARHAAITLHGLEGEAPSVGAELLADVKAVFDDKRAIKIFSADLLSALIADEEAPWATWNRGKPISPRQFSAKLSDFGIKSKDIRQGLDVKKGYHLEQFSDAFSRYLSVDNHLANATPLQPSNDEACSVAESATAPIEKEPYATSKTTTGVGCSDVADKTPPHDTEEALPLWDENDTEEL